MTAQIVALCLFAGVFALATLRKVHLGVIMLASAAGVGLWLAGMTLPDVVAGFPTSILVLLVGVTYFFGIAQVNGTVDRLIERAIAVVGDRAALLPAVFFLLTAGISAMGSPLAGLVMAPVAMPLGKRYGIDRMLMGISVGTGLSAGGFAPTSLYGIVTYGTAHAVKIDLNPLVLFAVAVGANALLLAGAYVIFGRKSLFRRRGAAIGIQDLPHLDEPRTIPAHPFEREGYSAEGKAVAAPGTKTAPVPAPQMTKEPMTGIQIITVLCMIGLIVSVVVLAILKLTPDIGVLCFAFGTLLTLIDPASGKSATSKIDWSTVLLVGGIITYVGVLEHMGAVELLGEAASNIGTPLISAFVICLIGGLVSAFASTTGILAALVPLAIPLVASGNIAGWAVIAALGVCSSIVDSSPFSTVGATLVATVDEEERPRMAQLLMRWGFSMVVIGPVLLVGVLVVPTMF